MNREKKLKKLKEAKERNYGKTTLLESFKKSRDAMKNVLGMSSARLRKIPRRYITFTAADFSNQEK